MTTVPPPPPPVTLTGVVERITFQSPETGFTVARLLGTRRRPVTIVGHLPALRPGETVTLGGHWLVHALHGRQFQVESCRLTLPDSVRGIELYLGSGLIRGIGPVAARKIVAHFGLGTFEIIDQTPARLAEVSGIGPHKAEQIRAAWAEHQAIKEIVTLLQSLGVAPAHAGPLYRRLGPMAVTTLLSQPYHLTRHVPSIDFGLADTIARRLGQPNDAPARLVAAVVAVLTTAAEEEGHVALPRPRLVERAQERLTQDILPNDSWQRLIEAAIEAGVADGELCAEPAPEPDQALIYLAAYREAELSLASRLLALATSRADRLASFQTVDFSRAFDWLARLGEATLVERQRAAVELALRARVSILTGGPGTGKTTCLRAIVRLAQAKGARVTLLAPTGRAAKRLADLTGEPASTIHRLLRLRPGGAEFDERQPLPTDLLIVDEASMLDLMVADTLVKALAPGTHLLLVGDVDQLPSVGAGAVLADLIRAAVVPVVRLETIFRQAQASLIIQNAYRVNQGIVPLAGAPGRAVASHEDYFLVPAADATAAADRVVELVATRLPRRYGLRGADIQVLAPMHRGPAGVAMLNERLQAALNPPAPARPELRLTGRTFRLGDRLLVTRNDYERQVFNGDLGLITAVDSAYSELTVQFDDGRVSVFGLPEIDELELAYALSIHKSQGSEFRAVVLPLLNSHYVMLARNLLYTALTRARELMVVVGQPRALALAVQNDGVSQRHGRLSDSLRAAAARHGLL